MSSANKRSLPVRIATVTFAAGSLTALVVQASVSAGCHHPGNPYVPPHVEPPEQAPAPFDTLDEPAAAMPAESQEPAIATSSASSAEAPDAGDVLAPPAAYLASSKSYVVEGYSADRLPDTFDWRFRFLKERPQPRKDPSTQGTVIEIVKVGGTQPQPRPLKEQPQPRRNR